MFIITVTEPYHTDTTRLLIGCGDSANEIAHLLHAHGVACSIQEQENTPTRSEEETERARGWMALLYTPTPKAIQ